MGYCFFAVYFHFECVIYRGSLVCMDPKVSKDHQDHMYAVLCIILTFEACLNLNYH